MVAKPCPGGEAPHHRGETPKDVHTGKWKVGKIQTGNSRTGATGTAGSHHLPPAASGGSGRAAASRGGTQSPASSRHADRKHSAVLGARHSSVSPIWDHSIPITAGSPLLRPRMRAGGARPPPEHLLPLPRRQLCRTGMVSAPVTFSSQHLGTFFLPL